MVWFFWQIMYREIRLAMRRWVDVAQMLGFCLIAVTFFAIGFGADASGQAIQAQTAPAIIWIIALLGLQLSLPNLFQRDYDHGILEQLALKPAALEWTVLAKILGYWLTSALPLIIVAPLLAMLLHWPEYSAVLLLGALLIGTLALAFVNAIGAALTLGEQPGPGLISLLVMPLYIPMLIFGTAASRAQENGLSMGGTADHISALILLACLLAAMLPVACFASAALIRNALE